RSSVTAAPTTELPVAAGKRTPRPAAGFDASTGIAAPSDTLNKPAPATETRARLSAVIVNAAGVPTMSGTPGRAGRPGAFVSCVDPMRTGALGVVRSNVSRRLDVDGLPAATIANAPVTVWPLRVVNEVLASSATASTPPSTA